jgi:flagellar biosynthetic protein FliR
MPIDLTLSTGTLYAFLLVLTRVSGALVFVPWPGASGASPQARAVFALGFTLALAPCWPVVDGSPVTAARLAGWVLAEAAVGIAIGVPVAFVLEAFGMAAQVLGLQAGYAYASTIDPNTEADSGILLVFAQLMGGLLFFALGLDRQMLRLFAESVERVPAGVYRLGPPAAQTLIHFGAGLFSVGVRLALPVVALLLLIEVAMALLGRLNQQLQLLSLSFPVKMLAGLLVLSWVAPVFPRLLVEFDGQAWAATRRMLGL